MKYVMIHRMPKENPTTTQAVNIRWLNISDYQTIWEAMRQFTDQRDAATTDEIWLLEHHPVFTQGQNGKSEHLLNAHHIPVVQSDRGGQITYHGPGQLIIYTLIDLKRKKWHIRDLITRLEQAIIDMLAAHHLPAYADPKAPGVYISEQKIASIGLRIRRGASYHGIAFNVSMDLSPFSHIHPCGFSNLKMTQFSNWGGTSDVTAVGHELITYLMKGLGYGTKNIIDQTTRC